MTYFLSPVGNDQQCDANGNPLVGGKIYTYLAGTTTPAATYTDSTSGTQQANPIILNSLGLPASPIWQTGGIPLKYIIKDSADVLIRTIDNVSGVNDTSSTASEWTDSGFVPTYISATQFSVPGDQTAIFQVNRRVRTKNTAGYVYGRITAAAYAASITTVTVLNDSGVIDAGITLVAYGFLSYSPTSLPYGIYVNVGDASQIVSKIQSLPDPTLASNAMTLPASTHLLDFRSPTLTTGVPSTVSGTAAALVVPAGASLGHVNGVQGTDIEVIMNIGGTLEKAIVNLAGGNDLSEAGVISTTAISAAATAANVFYSTTARTNVPYRVVRSITSTQATAGQWATTPSLVQGQGGQALTAMSSLGYGQSWQTVTRNSGTTYYNTTGKPIEIFITCANNGAGTLVVSGVTVGTGTTGTVGTVPCLSATIPAGASYSITFAGGAGTTTELR